MNNRLLVVLTIVVAQFFVLPYASVGTPSSLDKVAQDGNSPKPSVSHVTAKIISSTKAIIPGQPFKLGIELLMQPGWHTYYKDPGDAGLPTKIIWQLPPHFASGPLLWEQPTKFNEAGITTYGYSDKTIITSEIIPPKDLAAGKDLRFTAEVKWLSCHGICVPGGTTVEITLPIAADKTNATSYEINQKAFTKVNLEKIDVLSQNFNEQTNSSNYSRLAIYFIFAFIGGFLLNFMPCVLPVVAIKLLGLLEQQNKERTRSTAVAFATGIFFSFMFLGLLVVSLQSAGHKIGWGFQFQQPVFLMVMSALILLFALSLFGLFDFSFTLGQKTINTLANEEGFIGDFFKGVLATILSTPCTAPFLGTALGFAFVQPWFMSLGIFALIGAGMCLPYIVLIIAPQYLRFLPKPGFWMEKLKEAFGFILLATVFWLISILFYQIPTKEAISFIYFLLVLSFAVWLVSRFTDLNDQRKRYVFILLSTVVVICAGYFLIFKNMSIRGISRSDTSSTQMDGSFNIDTLNQALNSKKTVFLDFTAKWCLTCQINESTVLNTKAVQEKMHSLGVLFLKADWTNQDPIVTKLLLKFGRSGVPCYVIFPAKSPDKPIVLPELLTTDIVLNKLDQAGPSL